MVGSDGGGGLSNHDRGERLQGLLEPRSGFSLGGNSRWLSLGCGALVVVGLSILIVGVFELDRGVLLIGERARKRVLELLPADLEASRQQEIDRKMKLLFENADRSPEGSEMISRFIREVGPLLEDDRLTEQEVEHLDRVLDPPDSEADTIRTD